MSLICPQLAAPSCTISYYIHCISPPSTPLDHLTIISGRDNKAGQLALPHPNPLWLYELAMPSHPVLGQVGGLIHKKLKKNYEKIKISLFYVFDELVYIEYFKTLQK